MKEKPRRNRWQKGLAKVLAGVFCALSWVPAVHASERINLGSGDLLSAAVDAWWQTAHTHANENNNPPDDGGGILPHR
jgi:hypothetical protein